MSGWLDIGLGEPSLDDLPYGVFASGESRHLCVAIGQWAFDLHRAANVGLFNDEVPPSVLMAGSLNPLLALGPDEWSAVRRRIVHLFSDGSERPRVEPLLEHRNDLRLHLPWEVTDFVDFYSSRQHAENVGRLFRPEGDPLLPNWRYLPVGYHGRSGTVYVSGTEITRPFGQRLIDGSPAFGPTQRLDMEIEIGYVLGNPTRPGEPVSTEEAWSHIFGLVVLNDWSARDIQAFEYQPLGPFLGKSFATSVSAWVIPIEALDSSRVPSPPQDPAPLPHLRRVDDWAFDLSLDAWIRPEGGDAHRVSSTNARHLYWTPPQQVAHMTSNGAHIRAGDLIGTGTISGDDERSLGSLLELTLDGERPIGVGNSQRAYLADGDEVVITATANRPSGPSRIAEVRGIIRP